MSENIQVDEGEAPLITFRIKEKLPDGSTQSWNLVGVDEIKFTVKKDPDDTSALFEYTMTGGKIIIVNDGHLPTDQYSTITVQMLAADTVIPRNLFYRLSVWRGSRNDTVKKGFLQIGNI